MPCLSIGTAISPPPPGVALEGTVANRTLTLAAQLGITVHRRPLPLAELPRWQEAFLTSTRRRILPINRVDDHRLGPAGPLTRRLLAAYWQWEAAQGQDDAQALVS